MDVCTPEKNNKVTLHISVGVAGTSYNGYIIKPLISLGWLTPGIRGEGCWARGGGEQEKESLGVQNFLT
eukprot:1156398-Pelagomonas_calceolata.AAC.1